MTKLSANLTITMAKKQKTTRIWEITVSKIPETNG